MSLKYYPYKIINKSYFKVALKKKVIYKDYIIFVNKDILKLIKLKEKIKICTLNSNLVNSLFDNNFFNYFNTLILATNNEKVFLNLLQEISGFCLISYKKIFINTIDFFNLYTKYNNNHKNIYIYIYLLPIIIIYILLYIVINKLYLLLEIEN